MTSSIKLAFLFAALAWGQETSEPPKQPEQCSDQKQEIQRLTTLLNWYQQQFFALQARQIEQQVAPPKLRIEQKDKKEN